MNNENANKGRKGRPRTGVQVEAHANQINSNNEAQGLNKHANGGADLTISANLKSDGCEQKRKRGRPSLN